MVAGDLRERRDGERDGDGGLRAGEDLEASVGSSSLTAVDAAGCCGVWAREVETWETAGDLAGDRQ